MKNKKVYVKQSCCNCIYNSKNINNSYNQSNIDYIVNKPLNISNICTNCKPLNKKLPIYSWECLVNTNSLKYCIPNNQTQQRARSYRNFMLSLPNNRIC